MCAPDVGVHAAAGWMATMHPCQPLRQTPTPHHPPNLYLPLPLCQHPQGDRAAHNFLSETVVRSLPKGLTTAERERVLASTPLSPTLNLLSSMPLVSPAAG